MLKTIFLILFPLTFFCQTKNHEKYTKYSTYFGDLNGDKQKDKIVIYKLCNSLDEDRNCGRIAIYLKNGKKFKLYGFNDNLTLSSFPTITIKNQYFSLECLFGSCEKTFVVTTFKFDKKSKDFYLYKLGNEHYSCKEEDNQNDEINVKTQTRTEKDFGKVKFVDYK